MFHQPTLLCWDKIWFLIYFPINKVDSTSQWCLAKWPASSVVNISLRQWGQCSRAGLSIPLLPHSRVMVNWAPNFHLSTCIRNVKRIFTIPWSKSINASYWNPWCLLRIDLVNTPGLGGVAWRLGGAGWLPGRAAWPLGKAGAPYSKTESSAWSRRVLSIGIWMRNI